jgi:glutaredoxin
MLVKAFLAEADVQYETVNIDESEAVRELLMEKGFMAAPILLNEGNYFATVPAIQQEINRVADSN